MKRADEGVTCFSNSLYTVALKSKKNAEYSFKHFYVYQSIYFILVQINDSSKKLCLK